MAKCFVSFEICTVIFVLFSNTLAKGISTNVWALEGDDIKIDFSHPCDSESYTLQYESRLPFYDSGKRDSSSLAENQEIMFEYDFQHNYCSLQLKINPVLRSDKGVYVFITYGGDENVLHDIVNLSVDYPPGEASCGWGAEIVSDDLRSLECTAKSGSLLGEIICYQNGIRMNPLGEPRDRDGILEETMWVRYSQTAFCCSALVGHSVDRCKCKDYTYPHDSLTEPCPVTMVTTHQEASTSSQSPTSSPTKEVAQKIKKNYRPIVVLHVSYSCVIGISAIIIIGLCIALTIRNRKTNQVKQNAKTTNSQPDREDIEYMPVKTDEH